MTVTADEPVLPLWPEDLELAVPPPPPDPEAAARPAPDTTDTDAGRAPAPPLGPRLDVARMALLAVFVLAGAMVVQLTLVGSLQQRATQQRLYDGFRADLAAGTAPVGPTDAEGRPYAAGTPVAFLEIPAIGVSQVVVSGTSSRQLFDGPGHRRDTVLPGQTGVSIIMGRVAAYGGPFGPIDELHEGDLVKVTTGQGEFTYHVLGLRRGGDPLPATPGEGDSRLVLTTAEGRPFLPSSVLRVDAEMDGAASPGPGRLFSSDTLPPSEDTMAGDSSQLGALVLWLQLAIAVTLGAVWAWLRWGRAQAWVVFVPLLVLVGMSVANQAARLLPNLL